MVHAMIKRRAQGEDSVYWDAPLASRDGISPYDVRAHPASR